MTDFTLHTQDSAPQDSKPLLDGSLKAFGMDPEDLKNAAAHSHLESAPNDREIAERSAAS